MKDYLITILTRSGVLVNDQLWKAESMEHAEKIVNDFLYDKEFKGKRISENMIRTNHEKIGNNVKWIEKITERSETGNEVFFVSLEEENGTRWALKNA
jgi:hypothetical protein